MSETWIELDEVPEASLPDHARDGRAGDRVSFTESGLLRVRDGRAIFARWSELLGVVEQGGRVFVLVPRRPPAEPWIEVDASLLGAGGGDLATFAKRVRDRDGGGGYRDAVRRRRQNLAVQELQRRVTAREPIPGALEVPSTIVLGRSYPGLGFVQAAVLMAGGLLGYFGVVASAVATAGPRGAQPLAVFSIYVFPFLGIAAGAWAARAIGRAWRRAKDRKLPRQRVLVLAPDGCIVGFRSGVRTLSWSVVGRFTTGPCEGTYETGLVVEGLDGQRIGDVDAGYLEAPLERVVAVAEAYRQSAT